MDGRKSEVNPEFHKQFELFRAFIHTKLSPKKAIKKGEFVTGEGLAALVQLYVDALNTPDAVPNVEESWDKFANTKCGAVLEDALRTYQQEMTSFVENMMPCEADELRSAHEETMEKCLETFKKETRFFSIDSVAPHLQELTGKTDILLLKWLQTNKQRTEESCKALIKELEKTILDPVLSRLVGPDGSQMDFNELVEAYKLIEQRYKDEGRGDLETKALAFVDMNSRLNDEMTRNWDILKKLKNYDALLAKEKTQK
uniref:Guanylate-binding protein/Atlastin C-terminal domain-containing protein n=1 Tax=Exaiptasia diaphana TaxID=2652724 RepID=A0A913Y8Q7_EXADI